MSGTTPPSVDQYERLLLDRGLTPAEADAWKFLRHGPAPTAPLTLDIPLGYRDAGLHASTAREWFVLTITPDDAAHYERRGWTPQTLIELRHAIFDSKSQRSSAGDTPFEPQPNETDWILINVDPNLAPLYVTAGQTPGNALALESRRRSGDTTIEPTIRTIAALRRTPHL